MKLDSQIMQAAVGLHGAGGYRAQCGLVEGALLFIGLYGHRAGKAESEIVKCCYDFAAAFERRFGSLSCRELRPNGFTPSDPPHACEGLTAEAIEFAVEFVGQMFDTAGQK